jgi:hypothetical protein
MQEYRVNADLLRIEEVDGKKFINLGLNYWRDVIGLSMMIAQRICEWVEDSVEYFNLCVDDKEPTL